MQRLAIFQILGILDRPVKAAKKPFLLPVSNLATTYKSFERNEVERTKLITSPAMFSKYYLLLSVFFWMGGNLNTNVRSIFTILLSGWLPCSIEE